MVRRDEGRLERVCGVIVDLTKFHKRYLVPPRPDLRIRILAKVFRSRIGIITSF